MTNDDLESFGFYMPLYKSAAPERRHGESLRTVEGVAATEDLDQQDEELLLGGMDFTPFLKSGVINWNHQDEPGAILGEPIEAKIIKKGGKPALFFVKAFLYKGVKMADDAWDLINVMAKSDQPITRRLGWSVQGGVTERRGGTLVKSVVRHLALTHEPVNAMTFAGLAKSLAGVGIGAGGAVITPGVERHDLGPLLIQDLDGTLTKELFTRCPNDCLDPVTKSFRNGFHGALDHLVLCRKQEPGAASAFVTGLLHSSGR